MPKLEIACFSVESALIAIKAGAHRIELCGGPPSSGGLTPTKDDLRRVREAAGDISVHVMIRPRAGDFTYTEEEIQAMEMSIRGLDDLADGFVFGALDGKNEVNIPHCERLLAVIGDAKPCIFHRAVDETPDLMTALQTIRDLGFSAVLTSGGKGTASENAASIARTVKPGGEAFQVIVGGGVRASNFAVLLKETKAIWYHSSAIVHGDSTADADEIVKMLEMLGGAR